MGFSKKQELYAKFMLERIGYIKPEIIEKYLILLEKSFGEWKGTTNIDTGFVSFYYSVSNCIQLLIDEIDLKKNKQNIIVNDLISKRIAATDLSNYVYCPVSFSINKSFVINNPTGKVFTEFGTKLHEELRLINKIIPYDLKENEAHKDSIYENEIIKKIRSSEKIYIGHSEKEKYFINDEENYIGQPDYIFKDINGKFFIVEEKFHYLKPKEHIYWSNQTNAYEMNINNFFNNHIIQLISYIKNIKEYNIEYGYLIYWYYHVSDLYINGSRMCDLAQIHDVSIKQIELNQENIEFYKKTIEEINFLRNNGNQVFDTDKISINKCVNCVVNKYCTHKSGRLNKINYPFNKDDIRIFFAKFPDELKKQ